MDVQVGYLVRALRADPAMVLGRLSNDDLLEIQRALCQFLDERFAEDRVEIVINRCYGGFGISDAAKAEIIASGVVADLAPIKVGNPLAKPSTNGILSGP